MLLRAGSLICRAATHAGRRAQYSSSSSGSKCCSNGSIRFMSSTAPFGGDLSDLLSFGADGKITSTTATTRKTYSSTRACRRPPSHTYHSTPQSDIMSCSVCTGSLTWLLSVEGLVALHVHAQYDNDVLRCMLKFVSVMCLTPA